MQRMVAVLSCVLVGCLHARWQAGGGDPRGDRAFLMTADRAVIVEHAQLHEGRVGGRVVRMWQLPPRTQPMVYGDTPSETARRSGWVELPASGFFASDPANVQAIEVTEVTTGAVVGIVVVCALVVLAALAGHAIAQ